ncbi:unnamed protein product [Ectocarpus sp. 12 AP-2014]
MKHPEPKGFCYWSSQHIDGLIADGGRCCRGGGREGRRFGGDDRLLRFRHSRTMLILPAIISVCLLFSDVSPRTIDPDTLCVAARCTVVAVAPPIRTCRS